MASPKTGFSYGMLFSILESVWVVNETNAKRFFLKMNMFEKAI